MASVKNTDELEMPGSGSHCIAADIVAALSRARCEHEQRGAILTRGAATAIVREILDRVSQPRRTSRPRAAATDDEWLSALARSSAYAGIDIARELEKCKLRFSVVSPGCVLSRRRFLAWLNRCERPLQASVPTSARASASAIYSEPEGWREVFRDIAEIANWNPERVEEMARGEWCDLSPDMRRDILRRIDSET